MPGNVSHMSDGGSGGRVFTDKVALDNAAGKLSEACEKMEGALGIFNSRANEMLQGWEGKAPVQFAAVTEFIFASINDLRGRMEQTGVALQVVGSARETIDGVSARNAAGGAS